MDLVCTKLFGMAKVVQGANTVWLLLVPIHSNYKIDIKVIEKFTTTKRKTNFFVRNENFKKCMK